MQMEMQMQTNIETDRPSGSNATGFGDVAQTRVASVQEWVTELNRFAQVLIYFELDLA